MSNILADEVPKFVGAKYMFSSSGIRHNTIRSPHTRNCTMLSEAGGFTMLAQKSATSHQ
jgi:hypothetical protein